MPSGWGGNRRSGVELAMRDELQWFIHIRAYGLRKGDKHPAHTPHEVWHFFTCVLYSRFNSRPFRFQGVHTRVPPSPI